MSTVEKFRESTVGTMAIWKVWKGKTLRRNRTEVLAIFLVCLTAALLCPREAAGAYVTDSFQITLRSGPSTSHKILAMLESGQAVQVLQTREGWSEVRVQDGPGAGKTGWVLSRFLMDRLPWEKQAKRLQEENSSLKSSLAGSESEWNRLQSREKELTELLEKTAQELEALQKEYAALKEGSANYLKLKEEHEKVQQALAESQAMVKKLADENETLRFSHNIKWFATGALVLLCGWVIGLMMGRAKKKRRSTYFG